MDTTYGYLILLWSLTTCRRYKCSYTLRLYNDIRGYLGQILD